MSWQRHELEAFDKAHGNFVQSNSRLVFEDGSWRDNDAVGRMIPACHLTPLERAKNTLRYHEITFTRIRQQFDKLKAYCLRETGTDQDVAELKKLLVQLKAAQKGHRMAKAAYAKVEPDCMKPSVPDPVISEIHRLRRNEVEKLRY